MIPHFFWKSSIPKKLPEDLERIIKELRDYNSQEECLIESRNYIINKHKSSNIYRDIYYKFTSDLFKLEKKKYLSCNNLAFILYVILVKSGHFKKEDLTLKHSIIIFSPHVYLQVKLKNGKKIKLDPWAWSKGLKLGDYARGRHYRV